MKIKLHIVLLLTVIAIQLVSCSPVYDDDQTDPTNQGQQISNADEKDQGNQEQQVFIEADSGVQETVSGDVMEARPSLYYHGTIYDLNHYNGNKIDVTDYDLRHIGDMNYVGIKMSNDLDINDVTLNGSAVYTDSKHPRILIYHCSHCGDYFSIQFA